MRCNTIALLLFSERLAKQLCCALVLRGRWAAEDAVRHPPTLLPQMSPFARARGTVSPQSLVSGA
jgi:hypothetical protein